MSGEAMLRGGGLSGPAPLWLRPRWWLWLGVSSALALALLVLPLLCLAHCLYPPLPIHQELHGDHLGLAFCHHDAAPQQLAEVPAYFLAALPAAALPAPLLWSLALLALFGPPLLRGWSAPPRLPPPRPAI